MNPITLKPSGLRKPKYDPRQFKFEKAFGAIPQTIPDEFIIGEPLEIFNQGTSDMCVGFAVAGVSQLQEGVVLSPEWQFSKIKELMGGNLSSFGSDPQKGVKSAVNFGSLEKKESPYSLENKDRNFLADYRNWDSSLEKKALPHRKGAYFVINPNFDSIRSALWHSFTATNLRDKSAVVVGAYWQPDWNTSVMDKVTGYSKDYPHAFYLIGSKKIGNEPYLVGVNSYGEEYGDKGLFYLSKEVVNKYMMFAYTFKDYDPNNYNQNYQTILAWLWDILMSLKKTLNGIMRR
jgi:hypothetical protein